MNTEIRRPIPATIGVVFNQNRVLLVRRANPPDVGKWGFPGGKIEFGETIENAAAREILEETGIIARPQHVFSAVDCFDTRDTGLHQHYILVAVLCEWISGDPVGGDDALEARWFSEREWEHSELAMSMDVMKVIRQGRELCRQKTTMSC